MRLTSGLIFLSDRDNRVSINEREDDGINVYFESRFVAAVKETDDLIELIASEQDKDVNVTKAEAGIAVLVDAMRKMAA